MTFTTAVWICLVAAAGTTVVRARRSRPARVPVQRTRPAQDEEAWRPHITSGCGR